MNAIALNGWLGANRFLVVFALLASLMGTSVGVAKITTALYAIALGANAEQLGLLVAGQVAGTLVMSIPIGFLVDHYGPRRLFVLGSVLAGLTYVLIPVVGTPAFLLGCTTAIGFFMPLRFVSLNTIFFEQIRRMGAGKAGWYRATHLAGQFLIGPGIAVALIHALGYAGTWWILAASFALTIAVSPMVLSSYARPAAAGTVVLPSPGRVGRDLLALLRDRTLREICLIDIAIESVFTYQTTFVVAIALQVFHVGEAGASAFVTGTGLSFIATLLLTGGLTARLGARTSYRIGFFLATAGLLFLGSAAGPGWMWPGIVVLGIGLGLVQTVTLSRAAEIGGRLGQGKVSGLILMTFPIGGILGGLAGGWAGERLGLQAVYILFVPVFLALLAAQWRRADGLNTTQ